MECFLHQGIPALETMLGTQWALHNYVLTGCDVHKSAGRSVLANSFTEEEAAA